MKKGISEKKVKRMRNLVSGNYNSKTVLRSGYGKTLKDYKEGDIWKENGKEWTIKRGIKRTVNKLDSARLITRVPLACPSCNGKMNHPAHKMTYKRWGLCLVCTKKWELEMKANGTYDDWLKEHDAKNFNAFIDDVKHEYYDWLDKRGAKHHITEAGTVEDWNDSTNTEQLKKQFDKKIAQVREKRNGTTD